MGITRKNDIVELTDVDHCLLRPAIYIGSTKEESIPSYVYENDKIVLRDIPQVPGLIKIFDEVVSNSVDESIRTNFIYGNRIQINFDGETISVTDNGRGLPIEKNVDGKWVPEIIVTKLRAGSNFDDATKGNVMGQNGVGVALTNIYSRFFEVKTSNGSKSYSQKFENHSKIKKKCSTGKSTNNYTTISFVPNYDFFDITDEAKTFLPLLFEKRIRDLAFCYPEITFFFNKKKITAAKLRTFLRSIDENNESAETKNSRIGVFYSDNDFQQLSFVNGADTRRGGSHIECVTTSIVNHVREHIRKKHKFEVKPIDVKSKLFIMFATRMASPQFDSQTKERLINNQNHFKDEIDSIVTKKFLDGILKNQDLILPIVESYKLKLKVKEKTDVLKEQNNQKKKKIVKLIDAASKNRKKCTLFIVEGDSAGATFLSVRNEFSGALKLKGKIPNISDMKPIEILRNEELTNIMASIGLQIGKPPENLRYGTIGILTDADVDGNHITGLIFNFLYRFWPTLFDMGIVVKILPPLYIAKNSKDIHRFYSYEEWNKWKKINDLSKYSVKYFKGLGGLNEKEYERMINKPKSVVYRIGENTSNFLEIAFGKDTDKRKEWLSVV